MNQLNNSQLLEAVRTNIEAKDLIERLSATASALQSMSNTQKAINNHLTEKELALLMKDLTAWHIDLKDRSSVTKAINDTIQDLQQLPVLTLAIPFTPKARFVNEVAGKIANNIKERFLLDIKTDPSLLAGAVIFFKGRCSDFSLAEKYDKL